MFTASLVSDVASVVREPRVRRRLSLVWEVDHRPQPPADGGVHPESVDREEEDSGESERGTSEPNEEVEEKNKPLSTGAPVELDVRARSVAIGIVFGRIPPARDFQGKGEGHENSPSFLEGSVPRGIACCIRRSTRDHNDDARN